MRQVLQVPTGVKILLPARAVRMLLPVIHLGVEESVISSNLTSLRDSYPCVGLDSMADSGCVTVWIEMKSLRYISVFNRLSFLAVSSLHFSALSLSCSAFFAASSLAFQCLSFLDQPSKWVKSVKVLLLYSSCFHRVQQLFSEENLCC